MMHRPAAFVILPFLLLAPGAMAQRAGESSVVAVVESSFHRWDIDSDGEISAPEIDAVITDPSTKGPDAAAAAAIKLAMRSPKVKMGAISRGELETAAASEKRASADADDETEEDASTTPPNLQKRFATARRKITNASPVLFAEGGPVLSSCHQGPLGDCYFVAVVGGLLHTRPDELKAMFDAGAGPRVAVTFPGQEPVEIEALTDGQIAISSSSGKSGRWLPTLEHAFERVRQLRRDAEKRPAEPTDLIARGGSAGESIEFLTGHDASRLELCGKEREPTDDKVRDRAAKAREVLGEVMKSKRLAAVGTDDDRITPGISPKHAYAVLAFDESADRVTIWNPHGNTFKPKGAQGLKNGYATSKGVFTMPVEEMVRVFRGLVYETDRKAMGRRGNISDRRK